VVRDPGRTPRRTARNRDRAREGDPPRARRHALRRRRRTRATGRAAAGVGAADRPALALQPAGAAGPRQAPGGPDRRTDTSRGAQPPRRAPGGGRPRKGRLVMRHGPLALILPLLAACASDPPVEWPSPLPEGQAIEFPVELWDLGIEGET